MAIKPKNSGSLTRTQTASWQMDSMDYGDGMDNKDHPSYKALPNGGNQHAGVQNPNATRNEGRGATKGNTGKTFNEGKKRPVASAVPAFEAASKKLHDGTFNAGKLERNPGGTRPWEPAGEGKNNYQGDSNRINFGRGPTVGNKGQ